MITKSSDVANMIRIESGIAINDENNGNTVFTKEELLLIIAGITDKRHKADEKFIVNIVEATLIAQNKTSM